MKALRTAIGGLVAAGFAPSMATADLTFEANVFYFSDDFTYSTDSSNKRTFWDLAPGFSLGKKGDLIIAWNYASMSFSSAIGTDTEELTIIDMGPKVVWYLNKDLTWVLAFAYNLISKADYSASGATAELRGTSMKGEFGYLPAITSSLFMGIKVNYYKASFNEEITGATSLAPVTHGRAVITPSLALVYRLN